MRSAARSSSATASRSIPGIPTPGQQPVGQGGIAYLLESEYGIELPRRLQIDFARHVQRHTDAAGNEVTAAELLAIFGAAYHWPATDAEAVTRLASTLDLTSGLCGTSA